MHNQPLVSIIVIFYNAEQFITEALESILAQTYKHWELLLVDDGSTDDSLSIAQRYMENLPEKVHYLQHEGHQNRGMSASRNLGITNAKGELVAFLDADDVWLPTKLERQVAILTSSPGAAMVYGPAQWWYSWTGKPEDRLLDFIHDLGVLPNTLIQPPELLVRFLRREGISPCTCSVLLRLNIFDRIGGFEEKFPGMYEDQVFFSKVCLSAPIFVSSDCLARYRQHTRSNTSLAQEKNRYTDARREYLKWLEEYLLSHKIDKKGVWKALRIELLPFRHPHLYHIFRGAKRLVNSYMPGILHKLKVSWLRFPLAYKLRSLQLRRLKPLRNGRQWGTPIVRYYWDHFLQQNQSDIRGAALEIGTTDTIRHYGGQSLEKADAIDLSACSPEVTLIADLSRADHIHSGLYDCFINQFTSHLIYDIEAALYHSIRILKPGGVLLINFPCVDYYFPRGLDMGTGEPLFMYWWFTPLQVENLFRSVGLGGSDYSIQVYGNLFTRIAYQLNLPVEELSRREIEYSDQGHPLLVCARVEKPAGWQCPKPAYREPWHPDVMPDQWNPLTGHYVN